MEIRPYLGPSSRQQPIRGFQQAMVAAGEAAKHHPIADDPALMEVLSSRNIPIPYGDRELR